MNQAKKSVESALKDAVFKTLEGMAFVDAEVLEEDAVNSIYEGDTLWAVLPILQPFAGEIAVFLSRKGAKILTESLFSTDGEEVASGVEGDVLAEILNTIAGCFLNELLPPEQSFILDVPLKGSGAEPQASQKAISLFVDMGGDVLKVVFSAKDYEKFIE